MNFYKFGPLTFLVFLMLVLPTLGRAELREDVKFFSSVLNNINQSPLEYTCGAVAKESGSCSHLFNLFEKDKSTGLFFGMISESPWRLCKKELTRSNQVSTNEIEQILSSNERTSLGLKNNYFNSRINNCFEKRNTPESEDQKKVIVAMGYDYLNRIKKSTNFLADEVKKINSIVGDPIATGIPCGQFSMPFDAKICQDIKSQNCEPKNELNIYSNSLMENAIAPMIALKLAHKELSAAFSKTRTLRKQSSQEALTNLTNKMSYLESQFPILKGKVLNDFLDKEAYKKGELPAGDKLKGAVKAQLVENRSLLSKKISENMDMNNCLVYGDESFCKKFSENSERIPRHEYLSFAGGDKKNTATSEIYNVTECMDNVRGLKKEFNSFAGEFVVNVGLTFLTGGSGAILRAGGQGVKAAVITHKASLAADVAFLGVGINEAVDTCSKELNKLEINPVQKNGSAASACPASLSDIEHTVVTNYQGCVTGAMMASINALPFVPAVATKYLMRSKNVRDVAGGVADKIPKFNAPKKAFDPHDLRVAGEIMPPKVSQNANEVFKRDGVYVYIVDDKGNLVISHRTPDLTKGVSDADQFLGTHRGLYNKLAEKTGDVAVVSAGEIRVVGGRPISVSTRAGSFHTTPEEVLLNMKNNKALTAGEKSAVDSILKEMSAMPGDIKSNPMMLTMELDDLLDKNPAAKDILEKMQKELTDLTDARLLSAQDALSKRGLLSNDVETNFTRDVGGDAHIEGRAAAVAEINCARNKTCAEDLKNYQSMARKFLDKYKSPKKIENAIASKLNFSDLKDMPVKERAFQFYNMRSALLFKEGPIEFMKNANPERFGLTEKEALKYFEEWSKQFL